MVVSVRQASLEVVLDGELLTNVISARGEAVADNGWSRCSVFVTSKPGLPAEGQEGDLTVIAGAGNNVPRFVGKVRQFRPSAFPKAVEIVATGTLAYADEWAPHEDILFEDEFPDGATDQELIEWALGHVPGVVFDTANIEGTDITLGLSAPDAFNWRAGMSAWKYVQRLDRSTLYRTYQSQDNEIHRVRMIGHPNSTPDFTLEAVDMLDGATSSRDTERTRNYVIVRGYNYGPDQALGEAWGENGFQGPGDVAATRHAEEFSGELIENGVDEDGGDLGNDGLDARDIAEQVLLDVNKQFVEANVPTWRDDTHGPGLTCLVDAVDRLLIGPEPMWVVRYQWEVGDNGWTATYGMTGGGLPVDYDPPAV